MANFKTHIQFAAIGSGLACTALLGAQVLNVKEAFLCWLAGTIGGILPDIDSDNSYSLSILFGIFTLLACVSIIALSIHKIPVVWVWGLCVVVYCAMQFVVRKVFERFTIHRGICHSLLAGIAVGLLLTWASYKLGYSATISWFLGVFLGFGFLLHLLLDEIYSVDFMNVSVKRSFGTAIKLFDYGNMKTTCALSIVTAILAIHAPPYDAFIAKISNSQLYAQLLSAF